MRRRDPRRVVAEMPEHLRHPPEATRPGWDEWVAARRAWRTGSGMGADQAFDEWLADVSLLHDCRRMGVRRLRAVPGGYEVVEEGRPWSPGRT